MASFLPKTVNNNVRSEAYSGCRKVYSSKRSEKKRDSKNKFSNHIWITPVSNFKEKTFEAKTLLLTTKQVIITAIGPSIPHAINLAMILQSSSAVVIDTSTSTFHHSGEDYSNRKRYSSPAITIKVDLIAKKNSS